jgi:hypothetical protein
MEEVIESPALSVDEALKDRKRIDAAFRRAFRKAVLEHRRAGVPMVFWEDGKIVHVPADQVPLPEVEE